MKNVHLSALQKPTKQSGDYLRCAFCIKLHFSFTDALINTQTIGAVSLILTGRVKSQYHSAARVNLIGVFWIPQTCPIIVL